MILWLRALRLPSLSYILLPIALGQWMAFPDFSNWDMTLTALTFLYGVFNQAYIIFANDYADRETDALNKTFTIFSGGSRVLPNHSISQEKIRNAGILCYLLLAILSLILGFFFERPFSPFFAIWSGILLWAYSYPPIRLSYRGGGEFLQMVGLGLILPLFGYYIQLGTMEVFPIECLGVLFPTHLSSAIATSLPDEPSDSLSGKRTLVVKYGSGLATKFLLLLQLWSILFLRLTYGSYLNFYLGILFLGLVASVPFRNALPGQKELSFFVFLQILINFGIQITYFLL